MNLSTLDLRQILDAVSILNSDHQPETLPRRTFDSVKRLIPTDVISYEAFGDDKFYQGPLWFEPTENVSEQMLSAMSEYVPDHPIFIGANITEMTNSVRVSDFVTLPVFKRTAIYNEFFRYLGTDRQLSTALRVSSHLIISCSLCRLSRDYTGRDCAVLDLFTPHLTDAFRNTEFTKRIYRENETFIDAVASTNIGILHLNESCALVRESINARVLLDKYYGSFSSALPDELVAFVKYHQSIFADGEFYIPPTPLQKRSESGKLIIKIIFQSTTRTTVLLVEEITDQALLKLNGFGITARENQVLYWVSSGKTDPEIAQILQISVRTVHKHLENIFTKLGVENRTAAASFMFERNGEV